MNSKLPGNRLVWLLIGIASGSLGLYYAVIMLPESTSLGERALGYIFATLAVMHATLAIDVVVHVIRHRHEIPVIPETEI